MELFEDVAKPLIDDLIHCKNGKWAEVLFFQGMKYIMYTVQNPVNRLFSLVLKGLVDQENNS